jgi:heterodisulfide reductase subunit B
MDYNSQSKITEENYNPKIHVAEIKRTCNQCGKVWHVLAGREKQLAKNMCLDSCGLCGTCGSPHQAQYSHNFDSNHNELLETKKCPNCKSSNYEEEIIYYNK